MKICFGIGKGIKVRTRLYKVSPQQRETNEACNLTLMQKTDCDGLRIECAFTAEEAKYICGLDKEVSNLSTQMVFIECNLNVYDNLFTKSEVFILIIDGAMSRIHA